MAIAAEVNFTHPNYHVLDAEFLYCSAIKYLLNNHTDPSRNVGAYNEAV